MSGTGAGHNKFHTCYGCPDRSVEPSCHISCEGYKYRTEKAAEIKREKRKETEYCEFKSERVLETQRKIAKRSRIGRKKP